MLSLIVQASADVSLLLADIVAKGENRTTLKISRKSIFGLLCCCALFNAPTEVRDRFWINQYGPSHRRAQNASARNFRSAPQKDFCNKSAET
jgi:hypothetical protein